jgi:hypothetical protein
VLQGVNETLTHTIVSQGNGWATQSTTLTPSSNESCNNPIKAHELKHGFPGFSQTQIQGIHNFLRGSNFIKFHHWNNGKWDPTMHDWTHAANAIQIEQTADWLWNSVAFEWTASLDYAVWDALGQQAHPWDPGFYRLGFTGSDGAFNWIPYSFHQYMRGSNRTFGGDPGFSPILGGPLANDDGIVCSQVPAYASVKATGQMVRSRTYSKAQTQNAGVALWWAVKEQCMNEIGFFSLTHLGSILAFGCSKSEVCGNAAWQVVNCFLIGGDCTFRHDNLWNQWVNDPQSTGAISLSPDVLLGWGDKPTSGNGVSPWAAYVPSDVQFSGPANLYRCWY